ncbi:MAG: hypothetical protein M1818_006110 [Claussenomyces sp. TS43310]|nr:MAG: hypothetical protein M1818_006110 [Claussenomyces sp. TS43310]
MSFRKRNIGLSSPGSAPSAAVKAADRVTVPGVRPSPLDGRPTTSTGTRSLDALLAGHAGLALGSSLLIGESGTTDFGGVLLRYYAAEGVAQGHHVHVLGPNEAWGRELPGLTEGIDERPSDFIANPGDRMKIAWRYERLGDSGRGGLSLNRNHGTSSATQKQNTAKSPFCHDFDLSKRMTVSKSLFRCVPVATRTTPAYGPLEDSVSPYAGFLHYLTSQLCTSSPDTFHRVVIPNLLSPAIYPQNASTPRHLLQFLHALHGLLRNYASQLTAMLTFPLLLYPRSMGLTRWMEMLSDGVMELVPFPSIATVDSVSKASTSTASKEEPTQGLLKVHRLPVFHEKGGGAAESSGFGNDMAFTLSRKRGLVMKPFSLPPVGGGPEAQQENLTTDHGGMASKTDMEF